jgi:hypothetical protein
MYLELVVALQNYGVVNFSNKKIGGIVFLEFSPDVRNEAFVTSGDDEKHLVNRWVEGCGGEGNLLQ